MFYKLIKIEVILKFFISFSVIILVFLKVVNVEDRQPEKKKITVSLSIFDSLP